MPVSSTTAPSVRLVLLAAVIGSVAGLLYLKLLHVSLEFAWTTIPAALESRIAIAIYIMIMTTVGAAAVAYLRRRTRVIGHSPLDGLKVSFDPLRMSLIALASVIITLMSGAVLGTEAGLIALGAATGTLTHAKAHLGDRARPRLVQAGVVGALVALVLQMGIEQTIKITSGPLSVAWSNLVGSVPVAVAAALIVVLIRVVAFRLRNRVDVDPPVVPRIALVGFLVGLCAIVGVAFADINPRLILGSGEGFIPSVMGVTTISTLLIVLISKSVAYALCLGGGLRGGPLFPAMFLGATTATLFTMLHLPGQPTALVASGVLAGAAVGLALGWPALIIGGSVIGLLLGSWVLIAPSIVGLVVGRLVAKALRRLPGVGPVPDESAVSPTA